MATGLQVQGVDSPVLPELVVTASEPSAISFGRESPLNLTEVAPPSPSREPIILKNNLHKKGKRFKGWHLRYFELQGKHLYYYKNQTKRDCLGEIDLSLCIDCVATDEATFGAPFEIRTTVRTHALSARSSMERTQWIEAINTQVISKCEEKTISSKPKRWNTFRNAFKRPPRSRNPSATKVTKKKTIRERLRLRKSNAPVSLKIRTEPQLHNRPLSMTDVEIPQDTLEALLDVMPSRSLPATPLAKKRSEPVNYSPPESPLFVDPLLSLPPGLPTFVCTASVGANSFTFPEIDENAGIVIHEPSTSIPAIDEKADISTASTNIPANDENASISTATEPSTNIPEKASISTASTSIPTKATEPSPSIPANDEKASISTIDEPADTNISTELSTNIPNIDHEEPVPFNGSKQESSPEVTTSNDVTENMPRKYIWDEVREVLQESDRAQYVLDISHDILPKEEQVWMEHSTGLEQLRAFLAVCD